jgi:hypothetical protein
LEKYEVVLVENELNANLGLNRKNSTIDKEGF